MKNYRSLFLLLLACSLPWIIFSQEEKTVLQKKRLKALRIQEVIKIDGDIDEAIWSKAENAVDFTQYAPNPGKPASQNTTVKVLYDNKALYISAVLKDSHPDSILQQLSQRDELEISDWFGVALDPYQDGQNGQGFVVSPQGVQIDTKFSQVSYNYSDAGLFLGGDTNWDAVWDSAVKITHDGWTVEMKIPYSAIRFPKVDIQNWNINFGRMIRRNKEQVFWNEIQPDVNGLLIQSGILEGIENVQSPVRLSATPFVATYIENYTDKESTPTSSWGRSFNGGMDVKYGINDAFTLDMTLIPDFGEAQSDNQVLNLSAFEVRFDENRQFFTEGTELFNKGDIFYSRRVGGRPLKYYDVEDQLKQGEEIVENPFNSNLFNATKVSGRTKKGLGVGVFNATSSSTEAVIKDIESGTTRTFQTNPLTNYNVLVFDQNLKNNSSVTLSNTNVLRNGSDYDANVTAGNFSFRNKANTYRLNGGGTLSQKYYEDSTSLGHFFYVNGGKTSGNLQWFTGYSEEGDTYDPNDLGFIFNNNSRNAFGNLRYNVFKPFGNFNNGGVGTFMRYSRLYNPNVFTDFFINAWVYAQTKQFFDFEIWTRIEPVETYDYFDPRTEDFSQFLAFPTNFGGGFRISTDRRKKFAVDVDGAYRKMSESGRYIWELGVSPTMRFNDKFRLKWNMDLWQRINDLGYVDQLEGEGQLDVIIGRRDVKTFVNVLDASYVFNNRMGLTFRARHYWSKVSYDSFHLLGKDDGYPHDTNYETAADFNFNAFTIDAVYKWRFAPGSDIFVVWKNSIFSDGEDAAISYGKNLEELFDSPITNSLSLKIIYFLDYLNLKKS